MFAKCASIGKKAKGATLNRFDSVFDEYLDENNNNNNNKESHACIPFEKSRQIILYKKAYEARTVF